MLGKRRIILICVLLLSAMVLPVFAYVYVSQTDLRQVPSGVTIRTGTSDTKIGLYWDVACTQPVDSLDFGEVIQSGQQTMLWKRIYIRNEGNVTNYIFFNSTLDTVGTGITEWWCVRPDFQWGMDPLNGSIRDLPGDIWVTCYAINIPGYATAGTFNWTLAIWGEH